MTRTARSPLPWLGALLAAYLTAPIVAFVVRLGRHGAPALPGVGSALATSLGTATVTTALIALLGIPLAYVLARSRGRLARAVSVLVALPLALPPLMSGILLLYLVGPYSFLGGLFGGGLTDSLAGIVLAQTFVAAPFLVIGARAAFASVDPELEEVAQTLGHGQLARFSGVALAAAWPGVQAGLVLAWLRAFGEFGATLILAYHPYSLPVYTFVQFDSSGLAGTMLPVALALAAALVALALVTGLSASGRRRTRPPVALAPKRIPTRAVARAGERTLAFSLQAHAGDGFALEVEHAGAGARLALLGPSGAGKTLTLRSLAGVAGAGGAEIRVGGTPIHRLPPERRAIGYLPQHSALMPRRTVWQQVTFAADADAALAAWWIARLALAGLEDRFPHELSGGERRRVALARALARNPALVLLDEPFSALDAPVRGRLQRELRELQRELGFATVTVTHDPEEAALLADEVIVLDRGRAIQQGATDAVLAQPASPRVAALVGIPDASRGTVAAPGVIRTGGLELAAPTERAAEGREVLWSVRPERVVVSDAGGYAATVLDAVSFGAAHELRLRVGSLELTTRSTRRAPVRVGGECRVTLPPEAILVWDAEP